MSRASSITDNLFKMNERRNDTYARLFSDKYLIPHTSFSVLLYFKLYFMRWPDGVQRIYVLRYECNSLTGRAIWETDGVLLLYFRLGLLSRLIFFFFLAVHALLSEMQTDRCIIHLKLCRTSQQSLIWEAYCIGLNLLHSSNDTIAYHIF